MLFFWLNLVGVLIVLCRADLNWQDVPGNDGIAEARMKMDAMTNDVFRTMTKAHGITDGKRSRRSAAVLNPGFNSHDTGFHRLINVEPLFPLCEHPTQVDTTQLGDQTYAVCVSATLKVTLGLLLADRWNPLYSWTVESTTKAVIFSYKDVVYIVTAAADQAHGAELLRYDQQTNTVLEVHTIYVQYPTDIALWNMKSDSDNYNLAITSSAGRERLGDLTTICEWTGTYFDEYERIRTYDAKDVEAFNVRESNYLAVANYRKGVDDYRVDSEIFKFDVAERTWVSFQKIRTFGAVDVEFFQLADGSGNQEYFLAVANQFEYQDGERQYNVNSVIYKFVESRFVPFQHLPTFGATSLSALVGPRNEFLLVVTNYYDAVSIYQYNGWSLFPTGVQLTRGVMGPGALSASFSLLPTSDNLFRITLVIANPERPSEDNVFRLLFQYEDPLGEWYKAGLKWCRSAQDRFNSLTPSELLATMNNAYLIDQEDAIVIDGDLFFDDSIGVLGQVGTPELITSAGSLFDDSVLYQLLEVNERLHSLRGRLERAKNAMASAMRLSGVQDVTGQMDFHSAAFPCEVGSGCDVTALEVAYLNEDDVSDLAQNVIYLDTPAIMTGFLDTESLQVDGNVVVQGLVSGVNTSHLVTTNGDYRFEAPKSIGHALAEHSIVNGLVNELKLDSDHALLHGVDQTIHGTMTFHVIDAPELVVKGNVNELNINEFIEDIVYQGQTPEITGVKVIDGSVTIDHLDLAAGSTVNGFDLADMWQTAIWKMESQEIYAPMNFSSLFLVNPTVSAINGLAINPADMVIVSEDVEINSPIQFLAPFNTIDVMEVLDTLNSIGVTPTEDYPNQLDILLKSRDQTVYGQKLLPSLHLSGHGLVGGLVNGVPLAELLKSVINNNGTQTLPGDWQFERAEFRGPVEFHGVVDGVELGDLYARALRLDQPLPGTARVIFENTVSTEHLLVGNIDGVVPEDFVRNGVDKRVAGVKHFQEVLLEDNSQLKGSINGINLDFLGDTLIDGKDQRSTGNIILNGDLVVQDLLVGGRLNGVPLDRVLTVVNDEEVYGPIEMVGDVVVRDGMKVDSIQVNGDVNSQSLERLVDDSMLYSARQSVTGEKIFLNNLTILEGYDMDTSFVNGFSLSKLAADTLFNNLPRMVTGRKTFVGFNHFDNLNFYGTMDGVGAMDMMTNWVLQDFPQTIVGDLVIDGDLRLHSDVFASRVNNVDLSVFLSDVVTLLEMSDIAGNVHIKTATFDGPVSLSGKIQGLDLSEDAVLRNKDNVIKGRKHFANDLVVDGDFNVDGLLDGVDVSSLRGRVLTRTDAGHCPSLIVNGDVLVGGGLRVGGLIAGLDLADFNRSVWKINEPVLMANPARFSRLTINQPISLAGLLNGADILYLNGNYMSLTRDQDITVRLTLASAVVHGSASAANIVSADGHLNGMNLTSLAEIWFKKLRDQRVVRDVEFLGDVRVMGDLVMTEPLRGLNMNDDLMLKTRPNVVFSPLTFTSNAVIRNDFDLPDVITVQRVDVSEWAKNALYKHGHQMITGVKTFDKVTVVDARSRRFLGGVNVTTSTVLTTQDDQVIYSNVRFLQPVTAACPTVVKDKVNGVQLDYLRESVVYRHRPNVVRAPVTFDSDLVSGNVLFRGYVNHVNLSVMSEEMIQPNRLSELELSLLERQGKLDRMSRILEGNPLSLLYYSEAQKLGDMDVLTWASGQALDGRKYLFVSDTGRHENGCSRVYVFVYSDLAEGYVRIMELPTSFAVSLATFELNGNFHLAVANYHPVSQCSEIIGGLQIYALNPINSLFEMKSVITDDLRLLSVEAITLGSTVCLAAVLDVKVNIYCSRPPLGRFKYLQSLPVPNAKIARHLEYRGNMFLMLMGLFNTQIFVWDEALQSFGHMGSVGNFQQLAVTTINYVDEGERVSLLAVAEGVDDRATDHAWISVYQFLPSGDVKKVQQFSSSQVLSLDWVPYGSSFLLFSLSSDSNANVYYWKGSGGFDLLDTIRVKGAKTLHAFQCDSKPIGCHYLSISGRLSPDSWWQEGKMFSLLLKSKINGV